MVAFQNASHVRLSSSSKISTKPQSCLRVRTVMVTSGNPEHAPSVAPSRRTFLTWITSTTTAAALATLIPLEAQRSVCALAESNDSFVLPPLPYAYDGLEPRISERIMRAHHDGHFATYVKNLNKAVADLPDSQKVADDASLKKLIGDLESISDTGLRTRIRNNGGGYLNHKLFFAEMASNPIALSEDSPLGKAVRDSFGSFDKLRDAFLAEATALFGSGFTWLIRRSDGSLSIVKTPNQDNPAMNGQTPVLACDCWEHAWYYQYGPAKKDYFPAWWASINWAIVNHVYEASS